MAMHACNNGYCRQGSPHHLLSRHHPTTTAANATFTVRQDSLAGAATLADFLSISVALSAPLDGPISGLLAPSYNNAVRQAGLEPQALAAGAGAAAAAVNGTQQATTVVAAAAAPNMLLLASGF